LNNFLSSFILKNETKESEMKKVLLVKTLIPAVFISTLIQTGCQKPPSPEELKGSVEIMDVETKWVKKAYQPWPPKLILVPTISFRVKNLAKKPIRFMSFTATFRFSDESKNLGDGFMPGLPGEPIPSGGVSDTIFIRSSLGVEGKNLSHFKSSPHWKPTLVKLFAKSQGSHYVLLGEWAVSRKIDFKEPEPYPPKKEKKLTSY
jgi:hypothetical protein